MESFTNAMRRLIVSDRHTIREVSEILGITVDEVRNLLMGPSEERIRNLVCEEISNFLERTGEEVNVPEYAVAESMESAMVAIIQTVAEKEAATKVHTHEEYFNHTE